MAFWSGNWTDSGRNLLHCLACIQHLQELGVRFIAVTQGLDADRKNPASQFLLHVLAAAAEFERTLILERTQAGRLRYREDYDLGNCREDGAQQVGQGFTTTPPKKISTGRKLPSFDSRDSAFGTSRKPCGLGIGTVERNAG